MRSYVLGGGTNTPRLKDLSTTGGRVGRKKRLALAIGAALLSGAFSVMPVAEALPVLDAKDAAVTIAKPDAVTMDITSTATNNLIKWVDFSIAGGTNRETVAFDNNNYLNYVTGHAVSDIQGTLTGGGNIWLVNPNGILIGDNATVNVGNLYLSTRTLNDGQLASYSTATGALFKNDNGTVGDVINMGTLNATSISVEGNNITFKNTADVKNGDVINTNVKLTASDAKDDKGNYLYGIHIGSAGGTASGYTVSGAEEIDYKLISTAAELQAINTSYTTLDGKYMLAGDIILPAVGEGESNFTPIGLNGGFTGRFDGLNYRIQNLAIESDKEYVGLFNINLGVIENVGLVGGSVTGTYTYGKVGGIVGQNSSNGTVRNVYNTGSVTGMGTSASAKTGGIVGYNNGTVERAYNTGAVTGASNAGTGGIVGYNKGTVSQVYNAGTVSAPTKMAVGGIVGEADSNSSIRDAYNTGAVSGSSQIGGIMGCQDAATAIITNVYNSGTVNGSTVTAIRGSSDTSRVGGIVGEPYDDDTWPTNAYTSNLTDAGTFTGFDFSENGVWRIYDGKTTPLLTAFLTRKDNNKGTTVYNGTATGDVGTNYTATTYNDVQAQIGGLNYISDVSKVTPKTLTVADGVNKTYNGTTAATLTADHLSGVVEGDELTVPTTSATYADKNVGTGKTVTYAGLTLGGTKAGNYTIAASGTTTGAITKADITISTDAVTKTYDATTDAAGAAAKVTSGTLYGTDSISGGTFAFTDKNAGTGKTVTVSDVTVSDGNNGGNYNVTYANNTASVITAAPITFSVTDGYSRVYNGGTGADGATLKIASGKIFTGDSFSGGTFSFTDKNAGTGKTLSVEGVTIDDGNGGANYDVSYTAGKGTITKADVTFSVENGYSRTYDGTTSATGATLTKTAGTIYDGDSFSGGTFAFADKNAGEGKTLNVSGVTINDGNNGGNYNVTYTAGTGEITKADITISTDAVTKTYDGTTSATGAAAKVTSGTLYGTDTISGGTFAFTNANAGTGKTVNVSGVTVNDGNNGGNYNVTYANNTASVITAAPITFSVTDGYSRVYNGGTDADGATAKVVSGKIFTGDSFSGGTFSFADKNAGTGKTLSVEGVTIDDGNGGNNYDVSYTAGKGTITKKNLTATFADISKTYDGTKNATAGVGSLAGVLDGDVGKVSVASATATYADKNAGENKNVNYTGVTLTGDEAKNYAVSSATGKGRIEKADVTISAADYSRPYDGTTDASGATLAVTSGRIFDGDAISGGTRTFDGKDAGAHTISVSGVTVSDGNGGNNYNVTYQDNTSSAITRRALSLVADPVTITEGEATPTTWSGNVTGFVSGEGLGANDVYFFALDNPAAASVGKYSITGTLKIGDNEPATSGDYGANYTFANAASNATAFIINAKPAPEPTPTPTPTPTPQPDPTPQPTPQDIIEKATDNSSAVKEYTDVVASLESGANTVLPTTNVLPTDSVRPTENAQKNNAASGGQNGAQEQNGLFPAQQTNNGQPNARMQETQIGVTYTDINMPKSMSMEALAAMLNGETTQQGSTGATLNAAPTEPTAAMSGEPMANGTSADGENDEE